MGEWCAHSAANIPLHGSQPGHWFQYHHSLGSEEGISYWVKLGRCSLKIERLEHLLGWELSGASSDQSYCDVLVLWGGESFVLFPRVFGELVLGTHFHVKEDDGVLGEVKQVSCPGRVAWLEHHPRHQKVAGLIPGRGTYRRQPIDVSLSLSLKSIKTYPWVKILK